MEPLIQVTADSTDWGIVADDGTLYDTYALLVAAGKTPWPALPGPMQPESVEISSEDGSGGPGDGFRFVRNEADANFGDLATEAERDALSDVNYGSGQKEILSGRNPRMGTYVPTHNIWVRKLTGTDVVILKATIS